MCAPDIERSSKDAITTHRYGFGEIDRLFSAGWDELAGAGDFYVSTPWLRVLEASVPGPPTYGIAADTWFE